MSGALDTAILHSAALLVPSSAREEWLAEWKAELWYVEHDATVFCLGSFRDALWLRIKSFSARRALSLDSPWRCVLFLAGLATLMLWLAASSGGLALPRWSLAEVEEFAQGLVGMYVLSLLVLVTLNPLALGRYPTNRYAPSFLVGLRRWLFLVTKIVLVAPTVLFAATALVPIFPPASFILFLGWIFGFRWVLADQRRRCPACLHLLSDQIEIGNAAHTLFRPYGIELNCSQGHGPFHVPGTATSWCTPQRCQPSG